MLLVNLSSTFVNGLQGVVSGINKDSVSVMFNVGGKGNLLTVGQQIPLKLSYGMTIHKIQGMNLGKVIVETSQVLL